MTASSIPPPWLKSDGTPTAAPVPPPRPPPQALAPSVGIHQDPQTGRFIKGNPGRPKGSKNKATLAIEHMLEGEAETITRKCIELAKKGDPTALKIVFDRIAPVRKGRPLQGLVRREGENSVEALLRAVLEGELTPDEGKDVVSLIESAARVATNKVLREMREEQLALLRTAADKGVPNSVMIVPLLQDVNQWETIAANSQKTLKATAKD